MGRAVDTSGKATRKERTARKGLDFKFFVAVCLMLSGMALFILVQHHYSVRNGVRTRAIEEEIAREKAEQKDLRSDLARLKSPARIARIAQDELGYAEPVGVVYLKYSRDADGNLICQSTYERQRPAVRKVTSEEAEPVPVEDSSGPLTRR